MNKCQLCGQYHSMTPYDSGTVSLDIESLQPSKYYGNDPINLDFEALYPSMYASWNKPIALSNYDNKTNYLAGLGSWDMGDAVASRYSINAMSISSNRYFLLDD